MTHVLTTAEATVKEGEAQAFSAANDFKTLVANRVGDTLIAIIVIAAIWIGHTL